MKSNQFTVIFRHFFTALIFTLLLPSISFADDSSEHTATQTVNINIADAQTIAKTLKGIGLKKAEAIVDYRERYGEFAHLDELIAVKGIGKGTLSKNEHLLRLN